MTNICRKKEENLRQIFFRFVAKIRQIFATKMIFLDKIEHFRECNFEN